MITTVILVTGGKILPYLIELDALDSVFIPEPGNNQKFSYTVTGKGGNSNEENLEYLVLGIDPSITADQIKNITVTINGSKQTVRFNVSSPNVRIVNPDKNTGVSGLKFEFDLKRKNGVMKISFELTETYEVQLIPLALYGDETVKKGLSIGGPLSLLLPPDPEPEENEEEEEEEEEEED